MITGCSSTVDTNICTYPGLCHIVVGLALYSQHEILITHSSDIINCGCLVLCNKQRGLPGRSVTVIHADLCDSVSSGECVTYYTWHWCDGLPRPQVIISLEERHTQRYTHWHWHTHTQNHNHTYKITVTQKHRCTHSIVAEALTATQRGGSYKSCNHFSHFTFVVCVFLYCLCIS